MKYLILIFGVFLTNTISAKSICTKVLSQIPDGYYAKSVNSPLSSRGKVNGCSIGEHRVKIGKAKGKSIKGCYLFGAPRGYVKARTVGASNSCGCKAANNYSGVFKCVKNFEQVIFEKLD